MAEYIVPHYAKSSKSQIAILAQTLGLYPNDVSDRQSFSSTMIACGNPLHGYENYPLAGVAFRKQGVSKEDMWPAMNNSWRPGIIIFPRNGVKASESKQGCSPYLAPYKALNGGSLGVTTNFTWVNKSPALTVSIIPNSPCGRQSRRKIINYMGIADIFLGSHNSHTNFQIDFKHAFTLKPRLPLGPELKSSFIGGPNFIYGMNRCSIFSQKHYQLPKKPHSTQCSYINAGVSLRYPYSGPH